MKIRSAYWWIFVISGSAWMMGYAGIIAGMLFYPESNLLGGFDVAFLPYVYIGSRVFLMTLFVWSIHRIITMKNTMKAETHRPSWFPLIAFIIILCIYFSEDLTGIKQSLLRIPPEDYKGITQLQFENVGEKIKVGMDKSALTSLESVSSAIKRDDLNIDIEWGVRTAKHHAIISSYHFELSPDGKIVKIKKINYSQDTWD